MSDKFKKPEFDKSDFTCPHCQVVAQMKFVTPYKIEQDVETNLSSLEAGQYSMSENTKIRVNNIRTLMAHYKRFANTFCVCQNCKEISVWIDEKMVYPKPRLTPFPNDDLPDDIKADYEEASLIVQDSPRGACALLRLALQKLMIKEMDEDKNLDKAIQGLVNKKIIDETLQKALDSVRVIGNNAAHPNELDIKDDIDTALSLFGILNYIAEKMLTDKRKINEIYSKLPESAKRENRAKQ